MTRRRLLGSIAALTVAVAIAGCEKAAPIPGRVSIAGDSTALLPLYYGDPAGHSHPAAGWDDTGKVGLGWRARDAQPRVTADSHDPSLSPEVLVVVFGHNYPVWDQAAENEALALAASIAPGGCVVLAAPYYEGTNPGHAAAIDGYRGWVARMSVNAAGWVVTVDLADALAGRLGPDGIHQREGDVATALATLDVLHAGVQECRGEGL